MTPSRKIICGLFTLTLGICPNASLAQNPTSQQPSSPDSLVKGPSAQSPTKLILKEGTEVNLKLAQRLTTKGAVVGEPVELVLADDLKVGDAIVVKKGARVLGAILEGKESEKQKGEAHHLKIRVDFLKAGDVKIKLRGEEAAEGKRNKKAMAAGAVALGVSGLLLASQKRYVFEEGTPVKAYVDEDVELAIVSSTTTLGSLGLSATKANDEKLHAALNGGALAAPAQSREALPGELNRAEAAIEAAEAFEEYASYDDVPPDAKKTMEEKGRELQVGLKKADADLALYIKKNPRDACALLLQVRLDEVKGQVFPLGIVRGKFSRAGMPGQERDPQKMLDLIREIDPQSAEAYYLEARYWGMSRTTFTQNHLAIQFEDFAKAARFARTAVERAPENVEYREALATYLNAEGKPSQAMEALKPIQGANDPRCRLLIGESKISVPEGSVFNTGRQEQMLHLARDENLEFPALRVRAFLYPGPLSRVQEYYQQRWKDFRLQKAPGANINSNSFAIFEWRGDTLEFSPQPPTDTNIKTAQFLLEVGELTNLTKVEKERLFGKELLDGNPSGVPCVIFMFDRRRF